MALILTMQGDIRKCREIQGDPLKRAGVVVRPRGDRGTVRVRARVRLRRLGRLCLFL